MATKSGAALSSTVNYTLVRSLSAATAFFHGYPRIGNVSSNFAASDAYRGGVYRVGIPYFVVGVVLVLSALVANLYAYFRRGVVPGADDTTESDPDRRDKTGKGFLLFTCSLNLSIIVCIGIAFVSIFTLQEAVHSSHESVETATSLISTQLDRPLAFLHTLTENAASLDVSELVEDNPQLSLNASKVNDTRKSLEFLNNYAANFTTLARRTEALREKIFEIGSELNTLCDSFFAFTICVLLICLLALVFSLVSDSRSPTAVCTRITALLLLLLSLSACWSHTAITTWVGVASGDFCYAAKDFHDVVNGQASHGYVYESSIYTANFFLRDDLQCPRFSEAGPVMKRLNIFLGGAKISPWFPVGLNVITNSSDIPAQEWQRSFEWMQDSLGTYADCGTQIRLGGQLAWYLCGGQGISAISTVLQLWLCSCGLSLLLTVVVILLTLGHPPTEFCSGRELLYIYGAPKLISAFGDVRNVLSRQSTYRKFDSAKFSFNDSVTSDSEESQVPPFGDMEYDLGDDDSVSASRSISNKLQTSNNEHSDWYSDSEDPSSNLDGFS